MTYLASSESTNALDNSLTKPDPLVEVPEPKVVSGNAAVLEKAVALAAQVKPDAGASGVVTNVKAATAVDNGTFLHLQEVAAVFVSELLAQIL